MKQVRKKSNKKRFLIILLLFLMIIIINPYRVITEQYNKIAQTSGKTADLQTMAAQANDRYEVKKTEETEIVNEKGELKHKKEYSEDPRNNVLIEYETVKNTNNLFMVEKVPVPFLYYKTRHETHEIELRKQKLDATIGEADLAILDDGNKDTDRNAVQVKTLPTGRLFITSKSGANPFGSTGSKVATSRTIAQYKYSEEKELTPGEAYILSHDKETALDIDKVQRALWLFRYNGQDANSDFLGTNPVSAKEAYELYREAAAVQAFNENKANNAEQEIVDNMDKNNKYNTNEAGIVSFIGDSNEFLVGPFSINYTRNVIIPEEGSHSDFATADSESVNYVRCSAIVGARLYGLVNGQEVEIENWQFIYPDVLTDETADKESEKIIRSYAKAAKDNGEYWKEMYPFPNETFYIKLPNDTVEAITRIEFDMESLNAKGKAYVLTGTYSDVDWYAKEDTANYYIEGQSSGIRNASQLYQLKSAEIRKVTTTISLALGKQHDKYENICIPLTMNFSGMVWCDGTEVDQVNNNIDGTKGENETVLPGIIVRLYRVETSGDVLVEETKTNEAGRYEFNYIKAGKKYWIEFEYDGMKYKNTYPIYLDGSSQADDYIENSSNYLDKSHAIEDEQERMDFNNKFYEITKDTAISTNNDKTDMSYTYNNYTYTSENNYEGQIATVQEFPIKSTTRTANLIYPLHTNYAVTNLENSVLVQNDKNSTQGSEKVITIGKLLGDKGYIAKSVNGKQGSYETQYEGCELVKVENYLMNINLGLIERDPGDFAIKNDITQTTFSLEEWTSPANIADFGQKPGSNYEDFDIYARGEGYYNKTYEQETDLVKYTWRYNFTDYEKTIENDELQLYVQYKMTIRNQSNLLAGYITELSDYYDKELYYPVDSNEIWKYYDENTNYLDSSQGYADIIIPKLMQYSSWAVKNNGTAQKENLGAIEWKSSSKFSNVGNDTNLNKMYTTSLEGIRLEPGESIDVFIIFKVNRQENSDFGNGRFLINDNSDTGKRNIAEISGYRVLNFDDTPGGRVDIDSNPANVNIDNTQTYEDDVDAAPFLRVLINAEGNGKSIQGYVWEDSRDTVDVNNTYIYTGNGIMDSNEKPVHNVRVDLIRLEYNKETGQYEEVKFTDEYIQYAQDNNIKLSRYTSPQPNETEEKYSINDGHYVFYNLIESGRYKVRFNYGTEEQLRNSANLNNTTDSVKYNGHDYKSTEFDGFASYMYNTTILPDIDNNPSTKVVFVTDESNSVSETTKSTIRNARNEIINKLDMTHGNIETVQITANDDNLSAYIEQAEERLDAAIENKIMIIFTDGMINNKEQTMERIRECLENDILVFGVGIEGADEGIFRVQIKDDETVKAKVLYYNLGEQTYEGEVVSSIYERIVNNIMNTMILKENTSHATDYLENGLRPTTNEAVFGRADVMLNSQVMDATKARELDIEYIRGLTRNPEPDSDWSQAVRTLADNTRMTADSYEISINYDDNLGKVTHINLGLQEIPKSKIEVQDKVDNIIVRLSNNSKIIDLKDNLTQNVMRIKDQRNIIYMDEEIMQGSTITVVYKITINNIGEVDNLYNYLKYYSNDVKKYIYNKITNEQLPDNAIDSTLQKSVPITINNIYSYSDNLTFRAEDNNKTYVYNKLIRLSNANAPIRELNRDNGHIAYLDEENDSKLRARSERVEWELLDKRFITSSSNPVISTQIRDASSIYNVVRTKSLSGIELYPIQSAEVRKNQETAAIQVYLQFSKTLAANDFSLKDGLSYNNYVELIETQSITGRRDYEGKVGNYQPPTEVKETDTDKAELVQILKPFGDTKIHYILIATCAVILIGGIVFIKRKIIR